MPEYKCECCDFKTIDKGKYLKHNETIKHLKKKGILCKTRTCNTRTCNTRTGLKRKSVKIRTNHRNVNQAN